ncbi:2OG-Fe(II) oxygenase family protein [Ceratobasidium sp. AG-Ba]|nr:2OG-Fe(II) oxygenase family protein [Ceratobasidium sp. AG-Ba]
MNVDEYPVDKDGKFGRVLLETKEESRPQIYPTSALNDPLSWEHYGNGRFNSTELAVTSRVVKYHNNEHRMVICYKLPNGDGQIVHVLNNPATSQTPNDLFELYQKDACEQNMFQRHPIKTHGVKGELYAQHFSFNAGVPYKYIAEAISTPFDECPTSINRAVSHISYLCEGALGKSVEFNELLSVAYAEGQEMNFHSDDEPGLGSVVAGLTLGSSAEMIFRPNVSIKKNMLYKNGPYRPSESICTEAENERILHITLSHGDLLVMDGAKIQKNYEHAVFVRDTDLVRFAATARYIKPESNLASHAPGQATSAQDIANSVNHNLLDPFHPNHYNTEFPICATPISRADTPLLFAHNYTI